MVLEMNGVYRYFKSKCTSATKTTTIYVALILAQCSRPLPSSEAPSANTDTPTPATVRTSQRVAEESWSGAIDKLTSQLSDTLRNETPTPLKIAVFDLTRPDGSSCDLGSVTAEELTTKIFQYSKFEVVERRQLSKVMEEQKMSTSDLLDPNSAARLGQAVGAKGVVTGTISVMGNSYKFNARIISTESFSILAVADATCAINNVVESLGDCGGNTRRTLRASTTPKFASSNTVLLEGFTDVPDGKIPDGWSGGENDMVKQIGRAKMLTPFQKGQHRFFVPASGITEDFDLILDFGHAMGKYGRGEMTIQIGNLTAKIKSPTYNGAMVFLNDARGIMDRNGEDIFTKRFRWKIEKRGDLFKCYIDGKEIVFIRFPDYQKGEEVVLDFADQDYALAKFQIEGR